MAITDSINCDCSSGPTYRTLGQLRADVLSACGFVNPNAPTNQLTLGELKSRIRARLGFISPMTGAPAATMQTLRESVAARLGFIGKIDPQPRTFLAMKIDIANLLGIDIEMEAWFSGDEPLANMRAEVARMLGFAAAGSTYAPGMRELLDGWLNEAQQSLYKRIELWGKQSGAPSLMANDGDHADIDPRLVVMGAVALGKAHYGFPDAKVWMDRVERYLADYSARLPPGIVPQIETEIRVAQDEILRLYEYGNVGALPASTLEADDDESVVDGAAIVLLAAANLKERVGQKDAKALFDQYQRYVADVLRREPPNLADVLRKMLHEAQETAFRRYETGATVYSLAAFIADSDSTTIDYKPVEMLATASAKAFYKQDDAKLYLEQYERYMSDALKRSPPGLDAAITAALQDAQARVAQRLGVSPVAPLVADSDMTTVDYMPVLDGALLEISMRYGSKDAGAFGEAAERYFADMERWMPRNAVGVVNSALRSANRQLFMRYDALHTERWFSWPIVAGVALYDLPANAEACASKLNALKVRWAGVQDDAGGGWRPLVAGIPGTAHGNDQTGRIERYEIRQCVEVWPTPADTQGAILIKGHSGPESFESDSDIPTVDDELVYLMATANVKAAFKQQDAASYMQQMEMHLRKLVAGSHTTQRYIPGGDSAQLGYVAPKFAEPW